MEFRIQQGFHVFLHNLVNSLESYPFMESFSDFNKDIKESNALVLVVLGSLVCLKWAGAVVSFNSFLRCVENRDVSTLIGLGRKSGAPLVRNHTDKGEPRGVRVSYGT